MRAGRRVDRRRSYASAGPGWKIQEVSRVGAQGVTSKSKLLAREMPDLHTGGLRVDSGVARSRKGARAGQRVDRRGSYASVGPEWKIQEVSRVGAQGVASKSKLLALRRRRRIDKRRQIELESPPFGRWRPADGLQHTKPHHLAAADAAGLLPSTAAP